jgi:putative inorganic carbon (hco3(-)) transporter
LTNTSFIEFAPDRPFARVAAWWRARPWLAIVIVLGLWALMPGVRRLFDWRAGFASLSVLSIVPLVALVPSVVALTYGGRVRRVDPRLLACAWLWCGGFGISFVVAVMSGNSPFAAAYELAQFILPMTFGLWVATLNVPLPELYDRVAGAMLWLSTPLCLYAFVQFVAPPPWDVAWMINANIASIGHPFPYELRPFSLLNSPGVFADFLDVTLVLNLPRLLWSRSPLQWAQFGLCVVALALTMVRTGWLGFAVGVVTYILLVPRPARNLAVLGTVVGLGAILLAYAPTLLGSSVAADAITSRFSTFSDLDADYSYVDRQRYFGELLDDAFEQPLGTGLGVIGTAAKLGASGQTKDFDNGFVARFTEMGYFGMLCYLGTLIAMIGLAANAWRRAQIAGDERGASIAAAIVAVQVMLAALDVSSDHHNAFAGVIFWLVMGLILGRRELAQ